MTLALSGVTKLYGRAATPAVDRLDLTIEAGEIVALLGASGCGKTSTLRMIAGFEDVSAGTITLAGRRIDTSDPARRGVAMAFEGYALYPPLTVAENIGFGLDRTLGRAAAATRVRETAELLDIAPLLDRRPAALSGGQQQRVSLARALARDAALHLLDEPMGQLEPQLRAVLRGRVRAAIKARGLTAVLVTHDQTEAHAMADRIAVMEGGVLQQFGPGTELRESPANLHVATFLGEPPMNVFPATVRAGLARPDHDPSRAIPVPVADGAIILGIRPHRIGLVHGDTPARVLRNQWLGDQAHVLLDQAGQPLVAVSHERVSLRAGETVNLAVVPADLHVFDAATGHALAHGGTPT